MPVIFRENQLTFGVPLEDLSCGNDLHPKLKRLINLAYTNLVNNMYTISDILESHQGSIEVRLILKKHIMYGKSPKGVKVPPGAYFWVLRHFLGLLPLPLLPFYTNEKYFNWQDLIEFCKISLRRSSKREKYRRELVYRISELFNRLPECNFILIYNLLDFFWKLVIWPSRKHDIHKQSVIALTRYFSSSIFLRPYMPGTSTKMARDYYSLTAFLILYWLDIKIVCKSIKNCNLIALTGISSPCICNETCCSLDKYTQTEYVPSYKSTVNYCNTLSDLQQSSLRDCKESLSTICEIQQRCCCTYSSNYEQNAEHSGDMAIDCDSNDEIASEQDINNTNTGYGWIAHTPSKTDAESSLINSSLDEGYIYDDYNDYQYEESARSVSNSPVLFCKDNQLKERITKIGWTYTPPNETNIVKERIDNKTPNWTIPKENYNIYFTENNNEPNNLNEGCEAAATSDSTEILSEPLPERQSSRQSTLLRNRSLTTLRTLKTKLSFLRAIGIKKSNSTDDVVSSIKYKKMKPRKSSLF